MTTHSYVTMDVPAELWEIVRNKLLNAGYHHAVDNIVGIIDMHGIALTKEEKAEPTDEDIETATFLSDIETIIKECGLNPDTATIHDVIPAIKELKANQTLPDYTLGRYKDRCPHGVVLSIQCMQCDAERKIK